MAHWSTRILGGSILALALGAALPGCQSVEKIAAPSNFRDWTPEQALVPTAEFDGNRVTIRNIRNCQYFAKDVYLVDYYDKTFDMSEVRAVDFIVVPFDLMPSLAHTMLSFEVGGPDGRPEHIAVSVETRKERHEEYNPVTGSARQFELMYVIADERDVIQLRTNHRGENVYLYRSTATPEQAQALFGDILARANKLAKEPEFYDTLMNNCTTNIVRHINTLKPGRIGDDLRALLPGYSDQLAFDEGLIVRRGTFHETKRLAHVNPKAQAFAGREEFSRLIRR